MKELNFEVVKCSEKYWEFVRNLRNNIEVLGGFINKNHITKNQQAEYMKKNSKYFIIGLINGEPAGYFGVIDKDIRICTHPEFQKNGLGKFMLDELQKIWPDSIAKIKIENNASIKLFESAGYEPIFLIMKQKNKLT